MAASIHATPNGKSIVSGRPGKGPKIYIVSADGGGPRQVTSGPRNEVDPNWSPDGQSLIFADGTFLATCRTTLYRFIALI
jgi:Tol biopolymer transport system component